jgi:hypothetical protein
METRTLGSPSLFFRIAILYTVTICACHFFAYRCEWKTILPRVEMTKAQFMAVLSI